MGSYTTGRYKFYMPDGSELVDPKTTLEQNYSIIDTEAYNNIRWHFDGTAGTSPNSGQVSALGRANKYYHMKSGRTYLMPFKNGGSIPIPKQNNLNTWNTITLAAGFSNYSSSQVDRPAWRYADDQQTMVELKGRVATTNASRATAISMTAAGAVPNAAAFARFFCVPMYGSSLNNTALDIARIVIDGTGLIQVVRYGTASITDRFYDLSNIQYSIT